ncbi:MAG: hypothetical protein QOH20_627 [Mycobacterium sp.]|jgi:hypothetical protein|nr:hypothetical protein [Mycobacterium sp.]
MTRTGGSTGRLLFSRVRQYQLPGNIDADEQMFACGGKIGQ